MSQPARKPEPRFCQDGIRGWCQPIEGLCPMSKYYRHATTHEGVMMAYQWVQEDWLRKRGRK